MPGEIPDWTSFSNLETESVLKGEFNVHMNTQYRRPVFFSETVNVLSMCACVQIKLLFTFIQVESMILKRQYYLIAV